MAKVYILAMLAPLVSTSQLPVDAPSKARELYTIIRANLYAAERRGCVNRLPFASGYKCQSNGPGFRFERRRLTIDNVDLSFFESKISNELSFYDGNCVDYRDLEARFRERRGAETIRLLRTYDVSASDGGRSGQAEDYRFAAAKVTVIHRYATDEACIIDIIIEKPIR